MDATDSDAQPLCPSARPELEGAIVFGVVGGTAREPRVAHLARPLPVTEELLALAEPASPLAVFRTAAPCAASACLHFAAGRCRLATRIVEELPEAVDGLSACRIRPTCRWWLQEVRDACLRCPLVETEIANPTEQIRHATDPQVRAPSAGHDTSTTRRRVFSNTATARAASPSSFSGQTGSSPTRGTARRPRERPGRWRRCIGARHAPGSATASAGRGTSCWTATRTHRQGTNPERKQPCQRQHYGSSWIG